MEQEVLAPPVLDFSLLLNWMLLFLLDTHVLQSLLMPKGHENSRREWSSTRSGLLSTVVCLTPREVLRVHLGICYMV